MRKQQSVEVADILNYVVSKGKLRASQLQWKVVNAIIRCRTALLGGHVYKCTECGHKEPRYNSCRNRHCPKCQGADIQKWLQARSEELLEVPYFHTVFTIPHQLNIIFLQNKKVMFNVLFQAVQETLKTATRSRYGGEVGFFAVLHTWGQKMEFHPHIHCVIPGVILKPNSEIIQTKENYFLPDRVLNKIFRAVFLKHLEQAYDRKQLSFYAKAVHLSCPTEFQKLKNSIVKTNWVVYSKKPFSKPIYVLKYLARYTHRVAISNSRIKAFKDGFVTFTYKDYKRKGKRRAIRLHATEFTRRFLLHTLPYRFVRIRHYGFLANRSRTKVIQQLKTALNQTTDTKCQEINEIKPLLCPACKTGTLCKLDIQITPTLPSNLHTAIIPHRAMSPPASQALGG